MSAPLSPAQPATLTNATARSAAGLVHAHVALDRESEIAAVRRILLLIPDQLGLGSERQLREGIGGDAARIREVRPQLTLIEGVVLANYLEQRLQLLGL